jgi:hypothetical protein
MFLYEKKDRRFLYSPRGLFNLYSVVISELDPSVGTDHFRNYPYLESAHFFHESRFHSVGFWQYCGQMRSHLTDVQSFLLHARCSLP